MHPLSINGNRHVGAQHRLIMASADTFKIFLGGLGVAPPEAVGFLQSKGIKVP